MYLLHPIRTTPTFHQWKLHIGLPTMISAEDYIIGVCNHFFLLNERNCGYAQEEDLGCAVVCRKELWLCANGKI